VKGLRHSIRSECQHEKHRDDESGQQSRDDDRRNDDDAFEDHLL